MDLRVAAGEFVTLLGPSGCGKSTLLRWWPGSIERAAARSTPALRSDAADTAFVFQDATLMPWARVFDNVRLPLRLAGESRAGLRRASVQARSPVSAWRSSRRPPNQLSGGMKMRVSIARARHATDCC